MLMRGTPDEPCYGFGIKVVSNEGGRCGVWQLQYSQMRMFSKCRRCIQIDPHTCSSIIRESSMEVVTFCWRRKMES